MSCPYTVLYQIRVSYPRYNKVRVGGLCLCSSDFNRLLKAVKLIGNPTNEEYNSVQQLFPPLHRDL
jgi:hypothetical protein